MMQELGHPKLRLDAQTFESILAGESPVPLLPSIPPADPSTDARESDDVDFFTGRQSQLNARVLTAIARTDQQIKETDQRLSHIEARLTMAGTINSRIRHDRAAIKSLSRNLRQLSAEVASLLDLGAGRATKESELESKIDQMNLRFKAMEDRQSGLESRIAVIEAKLASVESRFEAAQAMVSIDQDRVGDAHKRLDTMEKSVASSVQAAESGRLLAEEISFRVESTARALTDLQRRLDALNHETPLK